MRDEDGRSTAHNAAAHVHACKLPMDRGNRPSTPGYENVAGPKTRSSCDEISVIGYQRPAPSFSDNAVSASSICSAAGGFST